MPQPGDRFGEFVLVREVGRGAMGVVWEARQTSLERTVALKALSSAVAQDPMWVARFKAEAGQAARLAHPAVLPVYAVGEDHGLPWYAMELVHGEDLASRLAREGPLEPREAARLVREAALGLHHAHEHGTVHRDVKPANLMVREDGRVAVTDFGLAKTFGSGAMTTTGLIVGTPYYLAPESIRGTRDAVGPKADVYGLGVTLYELLTGKPPFVAENTVTLLKSIESEEPAPPSRARPGIPRDLETIVLTCLAKDPARRYASAADLAEDLDRFLGDRTIATRRTGLVERTLRRLRRHRVATAAVAGGVLLFAATLWFFTGEMASQEERHREEIAKLVANAESLLDEGKTDEAEQVLQRVQGLEGVSAEDDARRRGLAGQVQIGRLFASLVKDRAAPRGEPGRVTVRTTPEGAALTWIPVLAEGEGVSNGATIAAGEERTVPAGVYRLHARAPGRALAIATVLVNPGAVVTVDLELPAAGASGGGMTWYAGVWSPVFGPPKDGKPTFTGATRRQMDGYWLADAPVSVGEWTAWLKTLPEAERAGMTPASLHGARRETPDKPVLGVTEAQALAYAKAKGLRLPRLTEMQNAAVLVIAPHPDLVRDAVEGAAKPSLETFRERLKASSAAAERLEPARNLAAGPQWVEAPGGRAQPWPMGVKLVRRSKESAAPEPRLPTALRLARS